MLTDKQRKIETDKRFAADESDVAFSDYVFQRLSAKGRQFRKVDFRYSVFDACYLRDCDFDSCDFTGCRFIGTNFHGSSFTGCKFEYAAFERTLIDSEILDNCCPAFENLKLRFARSLRMNYQQLGDAESVNKAILVELAATQEHLWKAWKSNESYYRKKYRGLHRGRSFLSWLAFKLLDLTWGNGESAYKLARSIVLILVVIAVYDALAFRNHGLVASYVEALVLAPQVLLGTKAPSYPGLVLASITTARLIAFGFFVSILVRRLSRR